MKKLTKKALMAIFALVLAVVALGTTTYAWFTIGQTVTTESIELSVRSDEGLEVRYVALSASNNSSWMQEVIPASVLENGISADYATTFSQWTFDHVTSTNGVEFKKLNTAGAPALTEAITSEAVRQKDSGILEFQLEFRTKASGASISWSSVSLDSTAKAWAPSVEYTHNKTNFNPDNSLGTVPAGKELNYFAHHAARVVVANADASKVKVYEDGSTSTNTPLSGNTAPDWNKGAHNYFNTITGKTIQSAWPTGVGVATTFTDAGNTDFTVLFPTVAESDGFYHVTLTIRVYLEGFDPDTINGILGSKLKVGLVFGLVTA